MAAAPSSSPQGPDPLQGRLSDELPDPRPTRSSALLPALLVGAAVLASRLPFLGPDFGLDYDAWLLADAAREIAETGHYAASRRPGYPLVERLFALFHGGGAWAMCAATAFVSVVAAGLTARLLGVTGARAARTTALAFAFTPVVWLASVTAMDYLWAWCLVLAGWYAVERERPVHAGVALGLAVAARITSGLMIAPLAWVLLRRRGRGSALTFVGLALTVGFAWYVPVLQRYGLDWMLPWMLPTSEGPHDAEFLMRVGILEVWGSVGVAALIVAVLALAVRRGQTSDERRRSLSATAWAGALLHLALFLWMPNEAGYLLPFAACVLIGLGAMSSPSIMGLLALALCGAGLFGPGEAVSLPADRRLRQEEERLLDAVVEAVEACDEPTVLLCGSLFSKLRYRLGGVQVGKVSLRMKVQDRERLAAMAQGGERFLFVNTIDPWHRANVGYSLWMDARPILPKDWAVAAEE